MTDSPADAGASSPETPAEERRHRNIVRRMYDWVLSWAHTPWGGTALFILAFAESSFFPVPPDVLLIALGIGKPKRAWWFAGICSLGSVLGGIAGYAIGFFLWKETGVAEFFFDHVPGVTEHGYERISAIYNEWQFWAVFAAGFTPIPYKLFTIAAGVFEINFLMFVVASTVGRSLRFFLVSWFIRMWGAQARAFIDRYFTWLSIGFTVLLIAGFVAVKYLL